jgi:hypothetical protein
MNLKNLLCLGLLFTTALLDAQTDFKPGYVIHLTGDTVYGEIGYRSDVLLATVCTFRSGNKDVTVYSPGEISAYRFADGKFYVSRVINGKARFLEILFQGRVNLYFLEDSISYHYYLDKQNEDLAEIPYSEDTRYINNMPYSFQSTAHKGLLQLYMADAPEIKSQIENIDKPTRQNLVKLALNYHEMVGKNEPYAIYEHKLPLIKLSIGPVMGLANYEGYDQIIMEFGGDLYLGLPGMSERISFKTGYRYNLIPVDTFNILIHKVPLQLKYIYPAHKLQPHISVGVNFLIAKFSTNEFYFF